MMLGKMTSGRGLALLMMVMLSGLAIADEKRVWLVDVPSGVSDTQVMRVVKQAFIGRRGDVVAADDAAVSATIKSMSITANIRVLMDDGKLVYVDSSRRKSVDDYESVERPATAPERWINNLRKDIGQMLATLGGQSGESSQAEPVDRLRKIKDLKDAGLITEKDYEIKKQDILKDI